jgi:hypothetical protein
VADLDAHIDDDERRGRGTRVALGAAVVLVVVAVSAFGVAGLLVALSLLAVVGAAVALLRVPGAPPPRHQRPAGPPVENAPFRSYRQVAEALSWAAVSPRHYDLVTRPLLVQLLASRLADHHRVDLAADPEAARRLVGDDLWHWLDPRRDVAREGQPPGVDLATLTRIVDRLEHL